MTCTSVRSLSCPGSDYISYIIAFLFRLPMLSYLDRILSTTVELATPKFEPVYEDSEPVRLLSEQIEMVI